MDLPECQPRDANNDCPGFRLLRSVETRVSNALSRPTPSGNKVLT